MEATAKAKEQNQQLESLIAQIEFNAEWVSADVDAQCLRAIGLPLDSIITTEQAFAVLKLQADERPQPIVTLTASDHKHFCVQCEKTFDCRCLSNAERVDSLCYDCNEGVNYYHRERVRLVLADPFA